MKGARQVVRYGLMGAVLFVAQVALAALPNIELVSLLVMVYALVLGPRSLYPIGVFVLLQGLLYGFGLWFLNYCYVWPILAGLTMALRGQERPMVFALLSGAFGLGFGALCAIPYLFIGGPGSAFAYWIAGIPFDLLHCAGNFAAALMLFSPARRVLFRLLSRG